MAKFIKVSVLAAVLAALLCACQSAQRKVLVVDADTGAPISGAFVYAYSFDALDPFASHGLYKTDESGEAVVKEECSQFAASAGKEGYEYAHCYDAPKNENGFLVSTVKLRREEGSAPHRVKIETFRKFSGDERTQAIAREMGAYFKKRNTIMATDGYPYIVEIAIKVIDADTGMPVPDALIFVRSGSISSMLEDVVATGADGAARASVNLLSKNFEIDTVGEGYLPTKRFSRNEYTQNSYTVFLSKTKKDKAGMMILLRDISDFSRSKTNNTLWERFKAEYKKAGGSFKYLREVY
ncbi:MAG: hypothetical protein IJI37_07460 [Opitutales bacterium]|nr:hypothetical protein [Opitutales bacterium]